VKKSLTFKSFQNEPHQAQKGKIWIEIMKAYEHRAPKNLTKQILKKHPFGLSTPTDSSDIHQLLSITFFRNIDAMPFAIIREISDDKNNQSIIGLRTILAEVNSLNKKQHLVYYEVFCRDKTLFIGHCSDCGGTGGINKEYMDSLVSYLSHRYGILAEKVEIPFLEASQITWTLP
jgi:hypothetical protein